MSGEPEAASSARVPEGARIDLHTHSSESDGTERPADLVRSAAGAGLDIVAITDHDTTSGWADAARAGQELGVGIVFGMELSTQYEYASVHVLAYLFDPDHESLRYELARVRAERLRRAKSMVERIGADYPITWDDVVRQTSDGATVGRPHIADALVERGIIANRSEAFTGILHWRGGYYRPHYAPAPLDGVRLIREAGGVPVLAHPATRGRMRLPEEYTKTLVDAGLAGVEIDHRDNTDEGKAQLRDIARRYNLIMTGSSDYHGDGKPNRLGENLTAPDQLRRILGEPTATQAQL